MRWRRWNAEILKARLRRDALMVEATQVPSESLEPDRRRRPSSSLTHSNCIFKAGCWSGGEEDSEKAAMRHFVWGECVFCIMTPWPDGRPPLLLPSCRGRSVSHLLFVLKGWSLFSCVGFQPTVSAFMSFLWAFALFQTTFNFTSGE